MYDIAREIFEEGNRCSLSSSEEFWCLVFCIDRELMFGAL